MDEKEEEKEGEIDRTNLKKRYWDRYKKKIEINYRLKEKEIIKNSKREFCNRDRWRKREKEKDKKDKVKEREEGLKRERGKNIKREEKRQRRKEGERDGRERKTQREKFK